MFSFLKKIFLILLTSIVLTSVIISTLGVFETTNKNQQTISDRVLSKEVTAHAQVGGYTLNRLTGWTSPYAEVHLNSVALSRKTLADGRGFFAFYNIPVLPNLGEICLVSQDVNLLPSFPTCLAPPTGNQDIDIINVLLSPSISIDSSIVNANSTVTASGMTFPDSPVNVYTYSVNETIFYRFNQWLTRRQYRWPWRLAVKKMLAVNNQFETISKKTAYHLNPVKTALAFSLPKYQIKSNGDGHFEFSLPGSKQSYNRFYVAAALNLTTNNQPPTTNNQQTTNNKQQTTSTSNVAESNSADANNNNLNFLPKTNIGAQAAEDEEQAAELRVSPKSNTLYFRSLGWLEGLFNRLLGLIKVIWLSFNNPFSLILIEIIIVLCLSTLFIYRKLLKDTEQTYL